MIKNPLACPFALSLAPHCLLRWRFLPHSLSCSRAPLRSLIRSCAPLCSLICSCAPLAHSLTRSASLTQSLALRCAHSFAHLLTLLTSKFVGKLMIRWVLSSWVNASYTDSHYQYRERADISHAYNNRPSHKYRQPHSQSHLFFTKSPILLRNLPRNGGVGENEQMLWLSTQRQYFSISFWWLPT